MEHNEQGLVPRERDNTLDYQGVTSSSIAEVAYDCDTSTLAVRFHNGREYLYSPVPVDDFHQFLTANSAGRYFIQHIRDAGYQCRRVR